MTLPHPGAATSRLAFHQQATDQLWRNLLGGAGEEGWGEVLGRSWWLWK